MVRLAVGLAAALSCAEAMSMTKQLSRQLSRTTEEPPKNFLILRLAHSGSSWFTSMIGAQNQTYVTREAMYPMHKPEELDYVQSLGKQGVLDYLEYAFKQPAGNVLQRNVTQNLCHDARSAERKALNATGALVFGEGSNTTLDSLLQPNICMCLHDLGSNCPVKFLGMTLDPITQVLKDNVHEIFGAIQRAHPNMPVIVYRRSNIVKRTFATGGLDQNWQHTEGSFGVNLHQEWSVDDFIMDLREALNEDRILREAARDFPNVKTVTYEALVRDPRAVMGSVFEFLGMPGWFEDWMVDIGDKHTPEDLRMLIANFDEVEQELAKESPCLVRQLRSTTNEEFAEICEDI